MASKVLPPGFRFHPTDVELVMYYLKRKILGRKLHFEAISEIDIYTCNPDDLPDFSSLAKSCMKSGDQKWYFFCPRDKRYMRGERAKRSTPQGFWKTSGNDRHVLYDGECAGKIKTLIFHTGKAPNGERTDWVMHEYRLTDKGLSEKESEQDTYVLCKIFRKEGLGPRNGAQYGAPFREEDWDGEVDVALPSEILLSETADPKSQNPSTVECVSSIPQSSAIESLPKQQLSHHPDEIVVTDGGDELVDDDMLMFGIFADEILNAPNENVANEEAAPDGNEIYSDLDDLYNFHGFSAFNGSESTEHGGPLYSPLDMWFHEHLNGSYMELSDIENRLLFTEQLSFIPVGPVIDELAPSEGTHLFDNHHPDVLVGPTTELAPLPNGTHLFGDHAAPFFQEMGGHSLGGYEASSSAPPYQAPLLKRHRQK